MSEIKMPPKQGWQCPVCGRVYAPWMPSCTLCEGVNVSIKWTKDTTTTLPVYEYLQTTTPKEEKR